MLIYLMRVIALGYN